jgi:eukaryotic-like serine/threonine-protein kinase
MGLTMTGTTLGSVAYMSPEQVRCEPLDGRSDLYSVGVSLYETITGQRPYVSDNNFEVMQAHLQVPPTPPIDLKPDIPPGLNQLILMAMAKNPAQRFQTADAMRGALRSVAPVLGEPTPFAPVIPPESTLDVEAPQTSRPATPSAPRSVTARPLTAQPITARPVTARPVTAQPLHEPLAPTTPAPPLAPTIPLAGSAPHYPQAQAPASIVATAQASAGNRSPLYITLSVVIVFLVLAAAGFGAKRWMDARSSENSSTVPADNPPPAADATTPPVAPAVQTVTAADPPPGKPAVVASAKPRATAPLAVQNPAQQQPPPQQVVQQPSASPQPVPAPQQPSDAPADRHASEQSARKTVASVAQFAAVEREEFDELQARDNKVNARIAALAQQPGMDIAVPRQMARNELVLAERALQQGDVQTAQKYMDQADDDITKLEKLLRH